MTESARTQPEVMTLAEAAKLARLHPRTIVKYALAGELKGRRTGRDWRFLRADVLRFIHGDRAA